MTWYLTVDVGGYTKHVFAIDDGLRAENAFHMLRAAITNDSGPYPAMVTVELDGADQASFRRTDLRGVSMEKSKL